MPLLRCVSKEKAKELMREVHEGFCGDHAGGQSLSKKILRQGYFWPTMNEDSMEFVRKCDKCQRFSKIQRAAPNELKQMQSSWSFAVWGIDLIGSLRLECLGGNTGEIYRFALGDVLVPRALR